MTTCHPCRVCTRMLSPEQYVIRDGKPSRICRQCHAGRCTARRLKRKALGLPEHPNRENRGMRGQRKLNRLFKHWRGPVEPAPLVGAA